MNELFASHGYLFLFVLSFLASTILPLGSEWLLVSLLVGGYDPLATVAVATAGNTLGACTTYGIGIFGGPFLVGRILRVAEHARQKAERVYARYGSWSLLFSWVPVVGDPLCLVGGILRIHFGIFCSLVFVGKLVRYAVVGWITLAVQAA